MKHEIKSRYHPDADQISAFVEHALPIHEQQQMLAHLAVCPECRATVVMSLPPENQPTLPAEQTRRIRWLTGWRLALPTGALVAITLLIFYRVHIGSSSRQPVNLPAQIAVSQPPAAPAIAQLSTSSAHAPNHKSKHATSPSTSAERDVKSRESITNDALISKQQAESGKSANKPAALQNAPVAAAASSAPAVNPSNDEIAGSPVQQPGVITPAREPSDAKSVPPVGAVHGAVGGIALKETAENPALLSLPSGLPILSEATHLRQILAVDIHNNLFLSDDAGATWKAVPVRWKGRAVQASLVSYLASSQSNVIAGRSSQLLANPALTPPPLPSANPPAQGSGVSLTGMISDQTGAAISGATVTATASGGKVIRAATSDANGRFVLDNLAPGVYDMKTQAPGFQQQLTQGVNVSATMPNVANVMLSVGSAAQTVDVQAADARIETSRPPAFASGQPTAPPPTPMPIFEITTDNGEHWTSADGMNWKPQ